MGNDSKFFSIHLGRKENGKSEFGVFVDRKKRKWCRGICTDQNITNSKIVKEWDVNWNAFNDVRGFEYFKRCGDMKEHYDKLTFLINPNHKKKKNKYKFDFYVNNTGNEKYSLIYIYSTHQGKMVFKDELVKPGNSERFSCYDLDHPIKNKTTTEEKKNKFFSNENEIFMIMIAQIKKGTEKSDRNNKDNVYYCTAVDIYHVVIAYL